MSKSFQNKPLVSQKTVKLSNLNELLIIYLEFINYLINRLRLFKERKYNPKILLTYLEVSYSCIYTYKDLDIYASLMSINIVTQD